MRRRDWKLESIYPLRINLGAAEEESTAPQYAGDLDAWYAATITHLRRLAEQLATVTDPREALRIARDAQDVERAHAEALFAHAFQGQSQDNLGHVPQDSRGQAGHTLLSSVSLVPVPVS